MSYEGSILIRYHTLKDYDAYVDGVATTQEHTHKYSDGTGHNSYFETGHSVFLNNRGPWGKSDINF